MSVATETHRNLDTIQGAGFPVLPQVASSPKPLVSTGTLETYASIDLTPSIGTEFVAHEKDGRPSLSVREVLKDPKKLRDLAILV